MSVLGNPRAAAIAARIMQAAMPLGLSAIKRRNKAVFAEFPGVVRDITIPTSVARARAVVCRPADADARPPVHVKPQHRFPAPPRQAWQAVRWIAEHGAGHGWDGTRLTVGGQSAGGGIAAAVARQTLRSGEAVDRPAGSALRTARPHDPRGGQAVGHGQADPAHMDGRDLRQRLCAGPGHASRSARLARRSGRRPPQAPAADREQRPEETKQP